MEHPRVRAGQAPGHRVERRRQLEVDEHLVGVVPELEPEVVRQDLEQEVMVELDPHGDLGVGCDLRREERRLQENLL